MFEKVVWKNEYNLGVPEIDIQHRRLVLIANELYDLACGDVDTYNDGIEVAVKNLIDYTDYHLKFEEDFLKRSGYLQVDFHKMQHDQFISQVNEQARRLVNPYQQDGLMLYDYLVKWLLNHIAKADKAWAVGKIAASHIKSRFQ